MTKTSFSSFLVEGVEPQHPGLAKKLEDIREFRNKESVADHEIAILRIGDSTDADLLRGYLHWMESNLSITTPAANMRARKLHMLQVLLLQNDFSVTPQARLRIERALASYRGTPAND